MYVLYIKDAYESLGQTEMQYQIDKSWKKNNSETTFN